MSAVRLAYLGFVTNVIGLAADAIASGVIVGGFIVASVGMVKWWSRKDVEERALRDGFAGGAGGLVGLLVDVIVKYAFQS